MDTRQHPATSDEGKTNFDVHLVQNDNMLTNGEDQNAGNEIPNQETDPLKMGHILEKIFGFLDAESIKAARQVNQLWSIEGAKILITKCYIKIPSAIHVGEDTSNFEAMDDFKAFLSHKSIDFSTILNITVDGVANLKVWKYLGVGQQVKSLKLYNIPSENEDEFFRNLLGFLPNLNYLTSAELSNEPKIIKALTSVMSTMEKNRNSLVISFLNLYPQSDEQLAEMEKFADSKTIMIEKLELKFTQKSPNLVTRVSSMLNKLLLTSQNVLKELTLRCRYLVLPLLEFPCMSALYDIGLYFFFQTAGQLSQCTFSPDFRFSEKVPKLQYITMRGNYKQEIAPHCFTNLLQSAGTAPSVKSTIFWGNVSDFDIYHIFKTFPNMEYFGTSVSKHSQAMLCSLWKNGKRLKKLRLDFDFPQIEKVDNLDSNLTGLAVWTVEEIKKAPNLDSYTLEEVEKLRIYPSILNLEELEIIQLFFHGDVRDDRSRMLAVAGKFGFSLLPKKPKIYIRATNSGSLDEIMEIFTIPNVSLSYLDH